MRALYCDEGIWIPVTFDDDFLSRMGFHLETATLILDDVLGSGLVATGEGWRNVLGVLDTKGVHGH